MRVLVATTPGWGHVSPVLPLVGRLAANGHEVLWVTAADAAARLADRGFAVTPCGLTIAERLPRAAAILAQRADGLPPQAMRAHAFTTHFAILGARNTLPGLTAAAAVFRPDVIVREPAELAAACVAVSERVPLVTVGFGALVPESARRMADDVLVDIVPVDVVAATDARDVGDLYLHPMPASMDEREVPAAVRRVRPAQHEPSPAALDAVCRLGLQRPAVYATFGTEFGRLAPWPAVVEALGAFDVDAVVTTGAPGLPTEVVVPGNVRIAEYIDQTAVFERVALVVSHGGSGTLLGAAVAGLPQVCVPLGADHFENTGVAVRRGIATAVMPDDRSVDGVGAAVASALGDGAMREAARAVALEIAAAPDIDEAASWVEEFARG